MTLMGSFRKRENLHSHYKMVASKSKMLFLIKLKDQ